MTKEELEINLQNHKKNKSILNQISFEIEKVEVKIKELHSEYQETKKEAIEGDSLKSMNFSAVRSKTNIISRPTENVAEKYFLAGDTLVYKNNSNNKIELNGKLDRLKNKEKDLKLMIDVLENALDSLTKDKKDILVWYYMEQPKWNYVQIEYINRYQEPRSIKQLQNVRDAAIIEMLNVINFCNEF